MGELALLIKVLVPGAMAAAVLYAMYTDMRSFQIPNSVPVFVALAFLPAAALSEMSGFEFSIHLAVGAMVLSVGMVAFAFQLIGGGDVKLFAAVAVWFGWELIGPLTIITALAGGVLAAVILILRSPVASPFVVKLPWLESRVLRDNPMPYGLAIGVAVFLLFPKLSVIPASMAKWISDATPW